MVDLPPSFANAFQGLMASRARYFIIDGVRLEPYAIGFGFTERGQMYFIVDGRRFDQYLEQTISDDGETVVINTVPGRLTHGG